MSRGTAKLLTTINGVVMIVLMFLFSATKNTAGIIITAAIYLPLHFYLCYCRRCKHCGRWPRKGGFWDEFCPNCGKKLE